MKTLFPVSQLGLAAYMFVVGLEFRVDIVRQRMHSAVAVSVAGMVAPFLLGAGWDGGFTGTPPSFHRKPPCSRRACFWVPRCASRRFRCWPGSSISRNWPAPPWERSPSVQGAIDDAAAWCLLAVVLASFDGDFTRRHQHCGGIGYVVVRFLVMLRPLLAHWGRRSNGW
jgi:Kef-type K+ transport system membrane component KefB